MLTLPIGGCIMRWTIDQQTLISKYRGTNSPSPKNLDSIPEPDRRYKCQNCFIVLTSSDLDDGKCPVCGEAQSLSLMCPLDHTHCWHGILESLEYCPICGEAICPECGTHDVTQISRVTGYMASVGGWNEGKQQELRDRVRYDPINPTNHSEPVISKVGVSSSQNPVPVEIES